MTIFNSYVKLPEGSFGGHASFNFEPLTWTEQNRVSILDRSPAWSGATALLSMEVTWEFSSQNRDGREKEALHKPGFCWPQSDSAKKNHGWFPLIFNIPTEHGENFLGSPGSEKFHILTQTEALLLLVKKHFLVPHWVPDGDHLPNNEWTWYTYGP